MTDFILGGSNITADGDRSHEIKRCLLLGRKAMTNLQSSLKRETSHAYKGLSERKKVSAEEAMLLNCGVGEDSSESLELQGDPTSQS